MSRASAAPETSTASALWTLRVAVTAQAALFVLQALTGGDYLTGNDAAMNLHGAGAITIHVVAGVQTLAAALLWHATRGPWWPTVLSAAVFGVSFVQAKLGGGDTLDSHLPLAVVLLIGVVLVLAWVWSPVAHGGRRPGV